MKDSKTLLLTYLASIRNPSPGLPSPVRRDFLSSYAEETKQL